MVLYRHTVLNSAVTWQENTHKIDKDHSYVQTGSDFTLELFLLKLYYVQHTVEQYIRSSIPKHYIFTLGKNNQSLELMKDRNQLVCEWY